MRRRHALLALVLLASCADILGIDDGTPRTYEDASLQDASNDATMLPDVKNDVAAIDGAPDVPKSPMACGTTTCNAIVEACCRTGDPVDASDQTFTCIAADAGCAGLKATCVEPANCIAQGHAGEKCCGVLPDGGNIATSTACATTCGGNVDLCQPGDDEICTGDASCLPSVMTIVGWKICK